MQVGHQQFVWLPTTNYNDISSWAAGVGFEKSRVLTFPSRAVGADGVQF